MEFKNTEEKIDIATDCGVQKGLQLKSKNKWLCFSFKNMSDNIS